MAYLGRERFGNTVLPFIYLARATGKKGGRASNLEGPYEKTSTEKENIIT